MYFNKLLNNASRLLLRNTNKFNTVIPSRSILATLGGSPGGAIVCDEKTAQALAISLSEDDRKLLLSALQDVEARRMREEFEVQLAAHRWRSKFGRPSNVPKLGDVDPTGTYCAVPDDWLNSKYEHILKEAAKIPSPSSRDLFHLAIANSIPFIGFGFLDNFIMIVAGDYIDHVTGSYICLSTMAAAALGNTFSDIAGIGSAFYVERFAERIGFEPPKLSPVQLDMKVSRRMANLGRVFGITLGCFLGMLPLLFIDEDPKAQAEKAAKEGDKAKLQVVQTENENLQGTSSSNENMSGTHGVASANLKVTQSTNEDLKVTLPMNENMNMNVTQPVKGKS